MINDVSQWFLVQIVFLVGFASGMYALFGDLTTAYIDAFPHANWTTEYDESCEMLVIGQYQTDDANYDYLGALATWAASLVLLVEASLNQGAPLSCLRNFSSAPWAASPLILLFQLFSAVLMLNMLIAMMAK